MASHCDASLVRGTLRPVYRRRSMVGMGRLVAAVALVSAVFCAGGISAAPAGAGAAGCGAASYSYAGLQAAERGHGVRATITVLDAPRVEKGHVAAWVGVAGRTQWIQVGVSGFEGSPTSNLYYEISRAGRAPQYFEVEPDIAPVATRTVAVLEVRGHPNWWRVWVNGRPVSKAVHLAGSHKRGAGSRPPRAGTPARARATRSRIASTGSRSRLHRAGRGTRSARTTASSRRATPSWRAVRRASSRAITR